MDQETKKKIYNLISVDPGLPLSKIAEILDMQISSVEQHLISMEKEKEIISSSTEGINRYYLQKRRKGTRNRRTQEIHRTIFNLLRDQPGLYLSKIAEKLNMSAQLAEYHLLSMEKNNLIIGIKEKGGYFRTYYIKDSGVGTDERRIVSLLRQEHLLRIVLLILKHPNIQHKELSRHLDITPGTLSHHLNRLDEYNIVEVITYGREKGYRIKKKKEITRIIRKYIVDKITERFTDTWTNPDLR